MSILAEWLTSEDVARARVMEGMCPLCGTGPWASPLNHAARKHGVSGPDLRDELGLSREKVTSPEARAKWEANGQRLVDEGRLPARPKGTKSRMTRRMRGVKANLAKWEAEHPDEVARLRATMHERVKTPEAKAKAAATHAAKVPACAVEGCPRPHKGHGYCENHLIQSKRGTLGMKRGEAQRALTPPQEKALVAEYRKGGVKQVDLGKKYGVTQTTVSRIVARHAS